MTVKKKRLIIIAIVCFLLLAMFAPIPTTAIPAWRIQVVDASGTACSGMRVNQMWGHYRLYSGGNSTSEDRFTNSNGYVQFPERKVYASPVRRIIVPVITFVGSIMHGGWEVIGLVWASGIKDVGALRYQEGKPLPDRMIVEKCVDTLAPFR